MISNAPVPTHRWYGPDPLGHCGEPDLRLPVFDVPDCGEDRVAGPIEDEEQEARETEEDMDVGCMDRHTRSDIPYRPDEQQPIQ